VKLAALALLLAASLPAHEKWTYAATENFEVYSTAGAGPTRDTLQRFETIREFFLKALNLSATTPVPVRLIAFKSDKEFAPYRPSEAAAAFYLPGIGRDYIVVGDLDKNPWHVAIHEYVHLLVKESGVKFPLWLNEGIAELFSTLVQVGDQMRVGTAPGYHLLTVAQSKPLPLDQLFDVDHDSENYGSKRHAGIFYSQSWALTHMIYLDPKYMPGQAKFIGSVANGTGEERALYDVFGKSKEQVYKDLEGYVRRDSFYVSHFPFKASKQAKYETRAVEPLEARVVTAQLLASMHNKKETAAKALDALFAGNSNSLEAHETAAYFHWRSEDVATALKHFEKASELGSKNGKLYADYAMLARDPAKAVPALRKAIQLQPVVIDHRVRLARALNAQKKHNEALAVIVEIRRVTPADAFGVFQVSAEAYASENRMEDARKALASAEKYAKSDNEKAFVTRFGDYLAQVEDYEKRRVEYAARQAAAPEPSRKVSASPPATVPEAPEPVRRTKLQELKESGEKMRGIFETMDCSGPKPVLHIRTGAKLWKFRIEDLGAVVVSGTPGMQVDLQCGPQKKRLTGVRYEPRTTGGVDGAVLGLDLAPAQ